MASQGGNRGFFNEGLHIVREKNKSSTAPKLYGLQKPHGKNVTWREERMPNPKLDKSAARQANYCADL